MVWWINENSVNTGNQLDDGILLAQPGDGAFTRDLIDAYLMTLGDGFTADLAGISWPQAE